MKILCDHEFERVSEKPKYTYFDYSGYKVGVFCYKCKKCSKIKSRKFLDDKQLGELFINRSIAE